MLQWDKYINPRKKNRIIVFVYLRVMYVLKCSFTVKIFFKKRSDLLEDCIWRSVWESIAKIYLNHFRKKIYGCKRKGIRDNRS